MFRCRSCSVTFRANRFNPRLADRAIRERLELAVMFISVEQAQIRGHSRESAHGGIRAQVSSLVRSKSMGATLASNSRARRWPA